MQTRILHLIIGFFFISFSITAQPQYTSADYATPGTIYLYNRLTGLPPIQELTQTGTNITWDLSANTQLNTHVNEMVFPNEGIDQFTFVAICGFGGNSTIECFSIWGNTEQALLLQDSIELLGFNLQNLQRYQNKSNTLLLENFLGFTVDLNGTPTQAVIVYNDPDTILHFPFTYNDSWSSDIEWSIDLTATGLPINFESYQVRTSEVDAWGTIITPYDTFTNVIRVRSEIQHTDTLHTDTIDLPINITQLEYMWYDTNYKLPVLVATGIATDTAEIITVVEYIYNSTCATPAWDLTIATDTFFTDINGEVTVFFEITNPNANEYQWDFGDGTFETNDGSIAHTYIEPGIYSVGVTGCMTHCLPLNTCTSDIIDFEILTSIDALPGEDVGIRLFPNPVTDHVRLTLPESIRNCNVQIVDIHGRVVHNTTVNSGTTTLDCTTLAEGVYTLQVIEKGGAAKHYYMRFLRATP